MNPDRDVLIEAVVAAWEAHGKTMNLEHRSYWWEAAPAHDIAALAVDGLLPALANEYRRGYIRGYCHADNGTREEFEWTEAEWQDAFTEETE